MPFLSYTFRLQKVIYVNTKTIDNYCDIFTKDLLNKFLSLQMLPSRYSFMVLYGKNQPIFSKSDTSVREASTHTTCCMVMLNCHTICCASKGLQNLC